MKEQIICFPNDLCFNYALPNERTQPVNDPSMPGNIGNGRTIQTPRTREYHQLLMPKDPSVLVFAQDCPWTNQPTSSFVLLKWAWVVCECVLSADSHPLGRWSVFKPRICVSLASTLVVFSFHRHSASLSLETVRNFRDFYRDPNGVRVNNPSPKKRRKERGFWPKSVMNSFREWW